MKHVAAFGALAGALLWGGTAASAPPPNITNTVGVCNPWFPQRCAQPDSNGALPVTGTVSASNPSVGDNGDPAPDASTQVGFTDAMGDLQAVSPSAPLPVTVSGAGTQDVNLTEVGGAAVATGHGTASGALRVELPTDGTGVVGLNAGSNTIGAVTGAISAVTGSVSAATITNSSAQIVAAASRRLLAISNESASASIACSFGGTAALNTAGSFMIPPLSTRTWVNYPVPADAVNCISSVASSPATVEAN